MKAGVRLDEGQGCYRALPRAQAVLGARSSAPKRWSAGQYRAIPHGPISAYTAGGIAQRDGT